MNDILSENDARMLDEILARELDLNREQLVRDARIMEDLGADSLTVVEIAMAVEERFDLSIPDERWERVSTVGDLYEVVAKLLQAQRRP